ISASVTSGSGAKLKEIKVLNEFAGNVVKDSTGLSTDAVANYMVKVLIPTGVNTTSDIFDVTATDDGGLSTTAKVTVTVTQAAAPKEYTATMLGAQGAVAGSFFSTTDGSVYSVTDANANQSKVDF